MQLGSQVRVRWRRQTALVFFLTQTLEDSIAMLFKEKETKYFWGSWNLSQFFVLLAHIYSEAFHGLDCLKTQGNIQEQLFL